jgi:hydroxymethylglutaryl-CoA reductase
MPMAVGIVGGATASHPVARLCLDVLGVETGGELAMIAVSVGLASNLAALAALASEGIQEGHMRLHGRRAT